MSKRPLSRPLQVALIVLAVAAAGVIVGVVALRSEDGAEIIVQLDWTVEDSCPDAVLIGAAGSGPRDDILGVGPQVESAVSGFSGRLSGQSSVSVFAGFLALDYPAPGIIEGAPQGLRGDADGMFELLAQGRETLTSLIGTISGQCQD